MVSICKTAKTLVLRREMFKRILSSNAADAKAVPWRQVIVVPQSQCLCPDANQQNWIRNDFGARS